MFRPSPATLIACVALFFSLGGEAIASQPHVAASGHRTITAGRAFHWTVRVQRGHQYTPCFYVGHTPLLIADLSHGGLTDTTYGHGTIARIHQTARTMRVTVTTLNRREQFRFRLIDRPNATC